MNSANIFPTPVPARSLVTMEIKGLIPSFKTQKRGTICKRKDGTLYARPITREDHKEWMAKTVRDFASQCFSAIQTNGQEITTEAIQQFLTASLPADDSWRNIPETILHSELNKDNPGATIIIEQL